ncbi:acyl--CoA ligase [Rhizobium sp. B230/85]|uniref:class I adenylate-forming enzyme family protein n=1 Tax=unclassified Rhizobium TaxID=2613769 RepID=UPI001ADBEA17|nr:MULTISPECIES: class I adenylate-forming enzyme family protein [unclassified Rhizobium]MBO9136286.1 acyl--CoA ligase [Rhizobium sp. B209b/85]QXZ98580.1 acyl--CoA ligase [Rhizobium sp. B230/85]
MLMHGLLLDGATRHPDRDCFHWVDRNRGLTYGEAAELMGDFAGLLHELGVRPGDRVTIFANNGLDYLMAMFGAWQIGAIAALVNVKLVDELDYYFQDHTPTVVIYTHDMAEKVMAAAANMPGIRALVCMDGPQQGAVSLPDMLAAKLNAPGIASDEIAIAHLAYTSGTTGKPKGAGLRHEPTVRAIRVIAERLRITGKDISFGPTALSSSYQLVGNLLPQLSKGAAINVMGRWTRETGFAALKARGATMLIANPPVLADYLDQSRASGERVASLRMGLSGGGPVPPTLKAAWTAELSLPLVESYGQSELGGFVALGYPSLAESDPTSCRTGPALPDKDVRILSPEGTEVPVGTVGEIVLTGGFMAGYWGKPDKSAEVLRNGFLMTGDIGTMDAEGAITMLGRRSELMRIGDRSWYPRDIEEALCAIATIRDAALVGVPGDNGLRLVAAVMLSGVGPLDAAACKTHLSNTTSYDIDFLKIVVVKEMPMTPTGKIAKAELTQMLGSGTDVQN